MGGRPTAVRSPYPNTPSGTWIANTTVMVRSARGQKAPVRVPECAPRTLSCRMSSSIVAAQWTGQRFYSFMEIRRGAADDPCDFQKLVGLTAQAGRFAYQFGLYINIDAVDSTASGFRMATQSSDLRSSRTPKRRVYKHARHVSGVIRSASGSGG